METCKTCGNPLDEFGMTNCNQAEKCSADRAEFALDMQRIKEAMTLPMIESMSKNEMPACFEPTRAFSVAVCGMLMEALRQNQQMADQLRSMRMKPGDPRH